MSFALTVHGLKKRYGEKIALNGLNLQVEQGAVYGFLGVNGAGKTTTFSILGGYIHKDEGEFLIQGKLALLPQDAKFYQGRDVFGQLLMMAELMGMRGDGAKKEVQRVLEIVELQNVGPMSPENFSHGMYKRLGIAQALLGDPDVLLLDEPTSGLDPEHAFAVRKLIGDLKGERTLMISSHNLEEIAAMCEVVGVIDQGIMIYEGALEGITGRGYTVDFYLNQAIDDLKQAFSWLKKWEFDRDLLKLRLQYHGDQISIDKVNALIFEYLRGQGVGVLEISQGKSLEEGFLDILGKK